MKTYYRIDGFLKFAEEDNYKEGCDPDTSQTQWVGIELKANTVQELIKSIQDYLDVNDDGTELNACDEPGRIDLSIMEDRNSKQPTKEKMRKWKRGELKLWAVTYTAQIEKVETGFNL